MARFCQLCRGPLGVRHGHGQCRVCYGRCDYHVRAGHVNWACLEAIGIALPVTDGIERKNQAMQKIRKLKRKP